MKTVKLIADVFVYGMALIAFAAVTGACVGAFFGAVVATARFITHLGGL